MRNARLTTAALLVLLAVALLNAGSAPAAAGDTTPIDVSLVAQGDGASDNPSISADGRYAAFESDASNLVAGDTNSVSDVFVYDRQTGETTRVSVASDGTQANDYSYNPSISADGRYVAFESDASNLVAGDFNGADDVFVHDRQTGETTRIIVGILGQANGGSGNPSISADGRYVAFESDASNLVVGDTNSKGDVFVHDRQTGETTRISVASDGTQANDYNFSPSISGDGLYVAFHSQATNMVAGDTNGADDVFVHDRQTAQTTRVSVASDGTQANGYSDNPSISADGRYVAFESLSSNLDAGDTNSTDDIFAHDRDTGQTTRVSVASDGTQGNGPSQGPSISADGRYVAFESSASNLVAGDTNSTDDIFAHDRQTAQTTRVSVDSNGNEGNGDSDKPSISADGRYAAFESDASNLVAGDTNSVRDVFVHDQQTGETTRIVVGVVGQANDGSDNPSLSAGGRYAAFVSDASNLVAGDTNSVRDVFVYDRQTGETTRVSVASDGTQANDDSDNPSISGDGLYVAFVSDASNLVAGDTNSVRDVFVYDRQTGETTRVSVASDGTQANDHNFSPSISADGLYVAFHSQATNLVAGDTNGADDVFVHDRQTGETTRISVASDGTQANDDSDNPSISADGRYVAFESLSSNLDDGDTNSTDDIFAHDRDTGQTTRVSVASDGTQGNGPSQGPSISADGRYVAFESGASNLVAGDTNSTDDIFVNDRQTGETTRVSVDSNGNEGNGASDNPSLSADGRYVAFESSASNLVAGDTNSTYDIFAHDRDTGQTTRVSVDSNGNEGNGPSLNPSISSNGGFVAFESNATNLFAGDINGAPDVFVYETSFTPTPTPDPTPDPTPTPAPLIHGDVNCDGSLDATDALAILLQLAGLGANAGACSGPADVECDGDVDAVDALHVLRHVGGLPSTLPPECPAVGTEV